MPEINVIYNLGVQDLRLAVGQGNDSRELSFSSKDSELVCKELSYEDCPSGLRHLVERILNETDAQKKTEILRQIRYPMVKASIDYSLKQSAGSPIKTLYFIVTDQQGKMRHNDTVHVPGILRQLIQRDYQTRVRDIKELAIQEKPNEDATAKDFVREKILPVLPEIPSENFVFVSAGIPTLNEALKTEIILHSIGTRSRANFHFHRLAEPDISITDDTFSIFLNDMIQSQFTKLIERYDYRGAMEVFHQFSGVLNWDDRVLALLEHADRRWSMDFAAAREAIKPYLDQDPMQELNSTLKRNDLLAKLPEFLHTCQICFDNRDFPNLIWRTTALYENCLRIVVGKILGVDISCGEAEIFENQLKKTEQNYSKKLKSFLRNSSISLKNQGRGWKINNYFLGEVSKRGADSALSKDIIELLARLQKLRNRVIHNLREISQPVMSRFMKPSTRLLMDVGVKSVDENYRTLMPALTEVLEIALEMAKYKAPQLSPYEIVNQEIVALLERG